MKHWRSVTAVALGVVLALSLGCTRYQRRPLSFRAPSAYPNYHVVEGAGIGARVIADRHEAREAFGFDIIEAGLLPVQVVISNAGKAPLTIVADQSFLVESDGETWQILKRKLAVERIEKTTGWGEIGPGAGKGALLGAAAGALVGVAIGVVTDQHTVEALGKGALLGGAGGGVIGGTAGAVDQDVGRNIAEDLRDASLENKVIEPGHLGHGILFFPGEARQPARLKLRLKNASTGALHDLELVF